MNKRRYLSCHTLFETAHRNDSTVEDESIQYRYEKNNICTKGQDMLDADLHSSKASKVWFFGVMNNSLTQIKCYRLLYMNSVNSTPP